MRRSKVCIRAVRAYRELSSTVCDVGRRSYYMTGISVSSARNRHSPKVTTTWQPPMVLSPICTMVGALSLTRTIFNLLMLILF